MHPKKFLYTKFLHSIKYKALDRLSNMQEVLMTRLA
jgi:hypothetical protein